MIWPVLRRCSEKIHRTWVRREVPDNVSVIYCQIHSVVLRWLPASWPFFSAFGMLGLILAALVKRDRWREGHPVTPYAQSFGLLWCMLGMSLLTMTLFSVCTRFRCPLVVVLAPFMVFGAQMVMRWGTEWRPRAGRHDGSVAGHPLSHSAAAGLHALPTLGFQPAVVALLCARLDAAPNLAARIRVVEEAFNEEPAFVRALNAENRPAPGGAAFLIAYYLCELRKFRLRLRSKVGFPRRSFEKTRRI